MACNAEGVAEPVRRSSQRLQRCLSNFGLTQGCANPGLKLANAFGVELGMSDVHHPKIVRIIARLNVGGPAKHVVWLTSGLDEAGYRSLLVAGSVPEGEEDMSYFADESGVKPLYIPQMSREISLKDAVTTWKLFRVLLRERPEIVHTHTAKAGTVGRVAGFFYRWLTPGVLVGKPRRCKFVHTYHGHVFHSYYGRLRTGVFLTIERLLARLVTDRIVVVSEQQRAEINETFRVGRADQFKVIRLGLDLGVFNGYMTRRARFRNDVGIDDQTTLVGIVGRLTEIKNHELFLRSVARFKTLTLNSEKFPPELSAVRFVIIGDGSLRETLEQQARALGVEGEVIFAGGRKDPEYFYPALDICALTSRNEGTPLTLIEAMANARPVIATNVGGVVDLLGKKVVADERFAICERGISVLPNDVDGFALGLKKLIEDKGLQRELGQRGFEFVARNYRKERLLEDIKNLYGQLLNREQTANCEVPVAKYS
jgi:glycosyltransferase involved in cell wall biosynthesis